MYNGDPQNSANGTFRYWGAADGPGGSGSGSGDKVSENVEYIPWSVGPVRAELDLSVVDDTLSSGTDSTMLHIITGLKWTVASDEPWIKVEPAEGKKVESLTIYLPENPRADPRTASIRVSSACPHT